ncbi:MAG: hypothetical protein JXA10_04345 [Anaerolineae bacterium]|nr:hypothetical protein [Anaerolineae bacterium]
MTESYQPDYVCVGGIVIDDIVFPDGETRMGVLGGGVAHAAAGMSIWDQRPGLCTCVGQDLPAAAQQRLMRDFDLQGALQLALPQARAWQLFEWDGRRTELPRVDDWKPFFVRPLPDEVPAAYHAAKGFHILRSAEALPSWRRLFPQATLFWEPEQRFMIAEHADIFRHALNYVDVVSPNLLEAQLMYGFSDPVTLVKVMIDDGAQIVALRMGEAGSLVGLRGDDTLLSLPAVGVPEIVDQTGAGNTYCGAFLVGWLATGDVLQAAIYGGVAASFALETLGVADPPPNLPEMRAERYNWLCDRVCTA